MNRDDIRKILGEGASEEAITNLLNSFHNAEKTKNDEINSLKEQNNKYSDYDSLKQQLDEINKAKMTEQEKIEADRKEAAQKLKDARIICNTAKVKEILAGEQIDESLLKNLVNEDEDLSIKNAMALKQTLTSLKDSVAKQTRESLATVDLTPNINDANPSNDVMNMDKFMNLSAEEQNRFIQEHPDEFNNLK